MNNITDQKNRIRSSIETLQFERNKPSKYFVYINVVKSIATTWTGENLGKVQFSTEFKSNMGDTRQSIYINAINGLRYYGTYFKSAGDYARITAYIN